MNYLTTHASLSPIRRGLGPGFVNYKKGAPQLPVHGRLFSLGTSASSTTKTGRNDIAEILLKVALNTKNQPICVRSIYLCFHDSTNCSESYVIFL